jgi:hypothetical protein
MPENSGNSIADSEADAKKRAILIKNMQYLRAMHLSYVKDQLLRNGTEYPSPELPARSRPDTQ